MRLFTPDSLLYPITVTKLLRQPGDDIEQNAPLFTYKYQSTIQAWDEDRREDVDRVETFYADFESEYEGTVTSLDVKKGQVLHRRTGVAEIEEPCDHEVQFGGICANCGKDMTTVQYNSTAKNTDRATVNTVHGHTQLLVSQEQASKADEEAKRRLLDSHKLSLVVDLDQTIIHATVDPTVAEWQSDPSNPNYDAVKDVRRFQLLDDGPGARGCWYYIKLRPGLEAFLERISHIYELHIYTMGTRAYAEEIAKIIDPERKIFGERILSRDESGSMTAKNLKRLFPVDSKMVVIIDDRGDVWHWSQNLIKVSPYDFFVGIGDINSSFLPKRPELEAKPAKALKAANSSVDPSPNGASNGDPVLHDPQQSNGEVSAVDRMVSMAGHQDEGSIKEKADEQDEQIAAQLQDRPLLQKQKILDAADEEAKASPAVEAAGELLAENGEQQEAAEEPAQPAPKYRHNLLQDDDTELEYLGQSLRGIHRAYYDEYRREASGSKGGRIADLRPGHSKKRSLDELEHIPDAAQIMANMKARVLQGVHLVFSGVVPLGVDIQTHDIGIWSKSFGATLSDNITKRTTHVIASPERRTAKVRHAAKKPGRIAIVSQAWLFACFTQWAKVDENGFRIHSDAPTNGAAGLPDGFESKDDVMLSSSDEEATLTEEEPDTGGGNNTPNGLRLQIGVAAEEGEDLKQFMPSMARADSSPTEEESPDYWGDINDELADFLGSDVEDESDNESMRSESSAAVRLKVPPLAKKRKWEAETGEEDAESGGEEGSRLQKRKREAAARTSSLTEVAKSAKAGGSPGVAYEDAGGGENAVETTEAVNEGDGDGDGDGDDELEAMLAAEMERQSNESEREGADGG